MSGFARATTTGDDDVSRLVAMRDTIDRTLSLYGDTISGWEGYMSNQERLYLDLLIAATTRDVDKYEAIRNELATVRWRFFETVSERGGLDNQWVVHVLLTNEEWQAEELWARDEIGADLK